MLLTDDNYDEEILCTLITESLENENYFKNCSLEDDDEFEEDED